MKPNPTQAHYLAEVNAAQSSAKGATTTPILTEGGKWERNLGHQGWRAGQKNKKVVGRERQRRHKTRHTAPQTPTSEPLSSAAATDAVLMCQRA